MRKLICLAPPETRAIPDPKPDIALCLPSGYVFDIIESDIDCAPFGSQFTHVSRKSAESLALKDPENWRIVGVR